MSEPKQVKVDNWGIYFLQRLKHFFNRTDYCDLTLQFQDNAQLKVHRLVLSACTEYFELLERTCEMYEDCLVMPDDLQADVVVPIVNFMYTGQLEFRMDILERLHATSEIMNMPVLTKLLDSHRPKHHKPNFSYGKRQAKHVSIKMPSVEIVNATPTPSTATPTKRTFSKAFDKSVQNVVYREKKYFHAVKTSTSMSITNGGLVYRPPSPIPLDALSKVKPQKFVSDPRPTRYELPEELDKDNVFENSFCNVSYSSQPLMVHPETVKQYAKRPRQDRVQASTSKKSRSSILDIVECKKIQTEPGEMFCEETESGTLSDETQMFKPNMFDNVKTEDPNKLFDQLLDQNEEQSAKVTIETTKNSKVGTNLDHAKIISEVLKKYPHLVKSNKNIKLKIFNNPTTNKTPSKKQKASLPPIVDKSHAHKHDAMSTGFAYETEVLDSKQAAKLIALGAENFDGPWICLICGAPGKALHFTSYYKFRRHLVEIHNEKPVLSICEYCGQRVSKRNHLLHHLLTKHGVPPPPNCNFPKCNQCNYIALTEALLVKHKLSHTDVKSFRCNVCPSSFNSSNQLLVHIQSTGHKYIADRKHSHQCIYCLRVFIRETNLYAHLKTHHKEDAVKDGIIDDSDDESRDDALKEVSINVKHEPAQAEDEEQHQMEYHIQQKPDGNIQLYQKKAVEATPSTPSKQKILNSGFPTESPKAPTPKAKVTKMPQTMHLEHEQEVISAYNEDEEEIVLIDNNEYIMSGNRLILKRSKQPSEEYILSDLIDDRSEESQQSIGPSTSMEYATILNSNDTVHQANIMLKNSENLSQSIPIYVSNEDEYKALMASNHSIIFDSADSNKTLTVLTTPDAATLDNTSINLEKTQNNEMMIIHEDYPLNVTEAVATDNSNIVVVYSHQVGDSNKEYQLLTTQALGEEYAQSAAILTQNYETVSSTSPVMSAHILDSQEATWQGDIHQSITNEQPEASAVIENIVHSEEVQVSDTPETVEEITDLPQVELIPNPPEPEPAQISPNEHVNSELLNNEVVKESQDISMEVDVSIEKDFIPVNVADNETPENVALPEKTEVVDVTENLNQPESQQIEQVPLPENIFNVEQPAESMEVQSSDTNENIINIDSENSNTNENINLDLQNSDTNENIISMNSQNPEIEAQENIIDSIEETANEEESTELPTTCTDVEESSTPEVVEQIQSFRSEWSEKNVDTPSQDSTEEALSQENINPEANPMQVEETVENIHKELSKELLETNQSEESVESLDSPSANLEIPESKEVTPETSKVDPQVKISSLLNDWDDNEDTHEGNNVAHSATEPLKEDTVQSELENVNVIPVSDQKLVPDVTLGSSENETETPSITPNDEAVEKTAAEQTANAATDNEIEPKQANIKSLVSDWDDDEEENKE